MKNKWLNPPLSEYLGLDGRLILGVMYGRFSIFEAYRLQSVCNKDKAKNEIDNRDARH